MFMGEGWWKCLNNLWHSKILKDCNPLYFCAIQANHDPCTKFEKN
jgi:hypothetical protein